MACVKVHWLVFPRSCAGNMCAAHQVDCSIHNAVTHLWLAGMQRCCKFWQTNKCTAFMSLVVCLDLHVCNSSIGVSRQCQTLNPPVHPVLDALIQFTVWIIHISTCCVCDCAPASVVCSVWYTKSTAYGFLGLQSTFSDSLQLHEVYSMLLTGYCCATSCCCIPLCPCPP